MLVLYFIFLANIFCTSSFHGASFSNSFWAFQKELLDESENIRFGKTVWKATKVVAVFSFMIEFTQLLFHKLNRYGILMFKVMCSGYIWEE